MVMSFMCQKGWHPGSKANQRKVWIAEQKEKDDKKRAAERAKEIETEQAYFRDRALISDPKEKQRALATAEVNFMYQPPPGLISMKEKEEKEAQKEKDLERRKELAQRDSLRPEEKFPLLKNAPTTGKYSETVAIKHKPFGVELRDVRCVRCREWGHTSGDKVCPLYSHDSKSEALRKTMEDPITAIRLQEVMEQDPLKLKEQSSMYGGGTSTHLHEYVPLEGEEATLETNTEEELLRTLSKKQKKKLVKYFKKKEKEEKRKNKSENRRDKKRKRNHSDSDDEAGAIRRSTHRDSAERLRHKRRKEHHSQDELLGEYVEKVLDDSGKEDRSVRGTERDIDEKERKAREKRRERERGKERGRQAQRDMGKSDGASQERERGKEYPIARERHTERRSGSDVRGEKHGSEREDRNGREGHRSYSEREGRDERERHGQRHRIQRRHSQLEEREGRGRH